MLPAQEALDAATLPGAIPLPTEQEESAVEESVGVLSRTHHDDDDTYEATRRGSFVYSPTASGPARPALRGGRSPTGSIGGQHAVFPLGSPTNGRDANGSPTRRVSIVAFAPTEHVSPLRRSVSFHEDADDAVAVEIDGRDQMDDDEETAVIDDVDGMTTLRRQHSRQDLARSTTSSFHSMDSSDRDSDASTAVSFRALERQRLRRENAAALMHMAAMRRDLGETDDNTTTESGGGALLLRRRPAAARPNAVASANSSTAPMTVLSSALFVTPPTPIATNADPPVDSELRMVSLGLDQRERSESSSTSGGGHGSGPAPKQQSSSTDTSKKEIDTAAMPPTYLCTSVAQLSDLPTELLRFAIDHFLSISHHYSLRLVCRRWNAIVVSNCMLWMRRVPNYLSHGYTSTVTCDVFVNTKPSNATFNRLASRSSFGNMTLASSTLSQDTGVLSRVGSFSTETHIDRYARPSTIHYCFRGCAYRTWRSLRLQKAIGAIRRFHRQKNKYYGGAAAFTVLFPPTAGYGTLVCCTVALVAFMVWASFWSDAAPSFQTPSMIPSAFAPYWVFLFFLLCSLYMWSTCTEVMRRLGFALFALAICATSLMEYFFSAAPSSVVLQVTPLVAPPPVANWTITQIGSFALSALQNGTVFEGVTVSLDATTTIAEGNSTLLYFLPIILASLGLLLLSAAYTVMDTRIIAHALELFRILEDYCEGVVPVRRLPRRNRDVSQATSPTAAAAGGVILQETGLRIQQMAEHLRTTQGGEGGGPPPQPSQQPDAATATASRTETPPEADTPRSYTVRPFAIFNAAHSVTGLLFFCAITLFAAELGNSAMYYNTYRVLFHDLGAVAALGQRTGSGVLYRTLAGPDNSSFAIYLIAAQEVVPTNPPSSLCCAVQSGFRLSFLFVVLGIALLLVRHGVGMRSSWRKVGRRLPSFTVTMVLIAVAYVTVAVASLGLASSRVGLMNTWAAPTSAAVNLIRAVVAPSSSSSGLPSSTSASVDVTFSCRPPTAFTVPELGFVLAAVLAVLASVVANLTHDKERYFDFKMVKYKRYFARLCAGEDLTTLGIERLLVAVHRFSESIGASPGPSTRASTTANSRGSVLRGAAS